MPLPLVGFFPWLVGLFASAVGSLFTWLVTRFAFEKAIQSALITGFIVAATALFLGVTLSIKTLIFSARIFMPNSLGLATFFLPSNINTVFAIIFTARVSRSLYNWTVSVMSAYLPSNPGASGMYLGR